MYFHHIVTYYMRLAIQARCEGCETAANYYYGQAFLYADFT